MDDLWCCAWLFVTPWTVTYQGPLSMRFFRQEILEWVAISFSSRSSQPRDQTQVCRIAGGFFTMWATRQVHEVAQIHHQKGILMQLSHQLSSAWWWTSQLWVMQLIKRRGISQYGRVCSFEVHVSGPFFMGPGFILSRSVPVSSAELLPGSVGTTFHRQWPHLCSHS